MSRFPEVSRAGAARFPGDVIPLQIGDTYLDPAIRLDDIAWSELAPVDVYAVQIAVGATHALSCAVQAVCDPGDELILLTPRWPLIRGIALAQHVVSLDAIEAAITPRTTALYFATPNNPDGAMLSPAMLTASAALCAKHGLRIALRVGYVLRPDGVIATVKKLVNHSVYNVPVAMQRAALGALTSGASFLARARAACVAARARARLRAPSDMPPGGACLWGDFSRWTGGDCMPVLERCASAGVLMAPGHAFGDACSGWARLCCTGVPADRLDEGIDQLCPRDAVTPAVRRASLHRGWGSPRTGSNTVRTSGAAPTHRSTFERCSNQSGETHVLACTARGFAAAARAHAPTRRFATGAGPRAARRWFATAAGGRAPTRRFATGAGPRAATRGFPTADAGACTPTRAFAAESARMEGGA